ncbi:uncharacterized protein [Asterias amurensis]|uniref:uncharacterized protein n=1 Tax=Asterias amurensis TaxID=7602 RepID=UPI003AB4123D
MDHTVSKMSHSLLFTLICAAVQLSFSSLSTTFVVDGDNSTFEIVLQPHRECPEKYYLHKARQGEFVLNDGRKVAKETHKLCIKCTQCLDGIEVIKPCTDYGDVVCGSKCVQSGFRFDEGTRSCQHEKVLDEGYTHEELRKYLAEQELSQNLVSEVGSTSKSTRHIETQTADVTEHRHQGLLVTVLGKSQASTPSTQTPDKIGPLFDEIPSTAVEVSDEAETAEEYLPRAAPDDHSESLQQLLFMVVLILLVFTVALYSFAAFRKCRPGFLSRILERRRQMPIPLTIRMSGGRVPTAVTVLPRLRTPTARESSREEAQPLGDDHDNDISDTSDSEENSLLISDSQICSCSVGSDDETFHEKNSLLGDSSRSSSCYIHSDYDTSDKEETSLLGNGSLKTSWCVRNDDDTSDNGENIMLERGSVNSLLSRVFNDDDIGDNEESVKLEDDNPTLPLRHVCNYDDNSDNGENGLLGDDNRGVCNDDDIDDNDENVLFKDENPVSPLSIVCDDNDIGDNGENNQSDVQGSPADDSLRSRNLCHELNCEEDMIIDDVFKIESSRNEDCLKGNNLLSEDVDVQPCSEEETPFKDTVVTEGDPQDDVFVTVSKKNNSVIDSGFEHVRLLCVKHHYVEHLPHNDVFVTVSKENTNTAFDCGCERGHRYLSSLCFRKSLSLKDKSTEANGESTSKHDIEVSCVDCTVIITINKRQSCVDRREQLSIKPFQDGKGVEHESVMSWVENSLHEDYIKSCSSTKLNKRPLLLNLMGTHGILNNLVQRVTDKFTEANGESTSKYDIEVSCVGGTVIIIINKRQSCVDRREQLSREPFQDGKGVEHESVMSWMGNSPLEDYIKSFKRPLLLNLMGRHGILSNLVQTGGDVRQDSDRGTATSPHSQQEYRKRSSSKKLNKRRILLNLIGGHGVLILVQTAGDVKDDSVYLAKKSPLEGNYRDRCSSAAANWMGDIIRPPPVSLLIEYTEDGEVCRDCGFEKSKRYSSGLNEILSVSNEHKTEIKVEDTEIPSVENVSSIKSPHSSVRMEADEHKTDIKIIEDTKAPSVENVSSIKSPHSSVRVETGEPQTEIKITEGTKLPSVENISSLKSSHSPVRMEADEPKTEIKIIEDTKVPSVENVSSIKSSHSPVRMEADEHKTEIKIIEDTKAPSVENVSGIKSPHSSVRVEADEPETEIKIIEDTKVPSVENVSSIKSPHSSVRMEADEPKTEIKIIEDTKVPSVENVLGIKSSHSPVRREADEHKTEIKIIEDTKVPSVENVSSIKSSHSPVRMEADEHKTEIKITEDSKVPSVENIPSIKSPHSSVRVEADDLKTKIKIIEDTNVPSVENILSIKSPDSSVRMEADPKTEIKIIEAEVPSGKNVSSIKSPHSPVSLEAGVDQVGVKRHDCNAERLLVTTECEISDELGTLSDTKARRRSQSELTLAHETRLRSRSMSGNLNPSARKTTSDEMHEVKQSLSMEDAHYCRDHSKVRICRLDSDEVQEETKRGDVEKASISEDFATMDRHPTSDVRYQQDEHQRNRFRLRKGRLYSWNDLHRCNSEETKKETTTIDDTQNHPFVKTRRRSRSYTEMTVTNETMRTTPHFDKMSPSVLNRRSHHSAPTMRQFQKLSSHVMNRGSLSVPTEPHSVDMSSRVDVVTRSFSAPTRRHFEKVSSPVMMNKRCLSAPTTPHIDMSSPVVNSRTLSVPPMQHSKQKSSPIINSKNSTTGRMRLTINPLSTASADFHQVDRNMIHKLDQLV